MSEAVKNMFSGIAGKYDLTNDVLSMGIHRFWRKQAVSQLKEIEGEQLSIIDVCTGTGDVAQCLKKEFGDRAKITGVDFVPEMIEIARDKYPGEITFQVGDAQSLEFEDDSFDALTISFGIRNVDSPIEALKEFRRILKPSGKLVVLEFGQSQTPILGPLFNLYSKHIIPIIGGLLTGDKSAYVYLPETSSAFPCREEFTELMSQAGFKNCSWQSLTAGIAYLYSGDSS